MLGKAGLETKQRILSKQSIKGEDISSCSFTVDEKQRKGSRECTGIPGQKKRGFQSASPTVQITLEINTRIRLVSRAL